MICFWMSGTIAAPISTPRSPRATITASVSPRIASSASTASAFSILAITCACEPAAAISSRRSRTSAAERTNERATKSTPRSSAKSRSSMSFRVRDGIGTGTPGTFTPLCVSTTPPMTTVHRARPRSTHSTRSLTSPSSMRMSCPGWSTSPTAVGLTGSSPSLAVSSARRRPRRPAQSDRRRQLADPHLRPLEVGDDRDRTADLASISRTSLFRSACSSCVPCEKFRRAASMPASAMRAVSRGDEEAGPTVATIFVRRGVSADMASA